MKRVLVLATMMTAAAALGAVEAEARLLDKRDLNALANDAAERVVTDDVDTIHTMLAAQGFGAGEIRSTSEKISARLVRDVRSFVASMNGQGFESFDDAKRTVAQRRLILRFSALNSPHLYAEGRALSYQVNENEAARLERSLLATWIEREPLLRKKLEELVMMGEMTDIDVTAVRAWTRKLAMARGKRAIDLMRGASFFSSADADYYLECAVVAEIERVRGGKLGDPIQRVRFIEESNTEYGAREEGAPVERTIARPASTPPPVNDERTAAIDFNK